jgi:GntP family gluconate:H+ symporter
MNASRLAATHLLAADPITPSGSDSQLIIAALAGIAAIILLITWLKLHPFLALALGAVGLGVGAGLGATKAVTSFSTGFGATAISVGILVGFGAMFGKLLADSGGADQIVDTIVSKSTPKTLPWAMSLVGALVGLPMFFEIGVVLLIPVIILVVRRSGLPLMRIAIPTLAGLSVMHGLVPPHPGPLVAIGYLKANLGLTLFLGVIVAIPTIIIAGPVFSRFAARWVDVPAPALFLTDEDSDNRGGTGRSGRRPAGGSTPQGHPDGASVAVAETPTTAAQHARPSFGAALSSILLPVVLMLGKALVDVIAPTSKGSLKSILDFLGTPVVALGIAVIFGIFVLGRGGQMNRAAVSKSLDSSLGPIANIVFIVAAGGGLKQVIIDTGIGDVIARAVQNSGLSVLLLAWFVAVLIRVATGSATVAITTAAGILTPLAATLPTATVSLMVLSIGSGSLFLSHVNDAGFWLVKQFLGLSVVQTLKTWTVMESLISVTGLAGVLILHTFI